MSGSCCNIRNSHLVANNCLLFSQEKFLLLDHLNSNISLKDMKLRRKEGQRTTKGMTVNTSSFASDFSLNVSSSLSGMAKYPISLLSYGDIMTIFTSFLLHINNFQVKFMKVKG